MYRYIFYRVFRWASRLHDGKDHPAHTALWTMSLLASANLLSASLIIAITSSPSLFERVDLVKWIAAGLFLGLVGIHFHFFMRGDGITHLVAEFEEESPMVSAKGDAIFRAYVIGSVGVFVALILSVATYRSPIAS